MFGERCYTFHVCDPWYTKLWVHIKYYTYPGACYLIKSGIEIEVDFDYMSEYENGEE